MKVISSEIIDGDSILFMTVPDGEMAGKKLLAGRFICKDATCLCTVVKIKLADMNNLDQDIATFDLDVASCKLSAKDPQYSDPSFVSSLGVPLATSLVESFDAEDWAFLKEDFYSYKLAVTKKIDFDSTSAYFPTASAIENYGEMVGYSDILPFCEQFILPRTEDSVDAILLDDQYCVISGCDCTRAIIFMYSCKNGREISGIKQGIEINLNTFRITQILEDTGGRETAVKLWHQFLEAFPQIRKELPRRKKDLTKLYANFKKNPRSVKFVPASKSTSGATLENVGRNDSCPCGSGKKFKKCCLGKPSFVL
jgi:hypothetical protein